jgi:hypothetical protein
MMRLRALIMIEFLDNNWSHQINSIKMIHRQIKMCEWSELVLYRRADHMTFFEYNSSRTIIIFAIVLSLVHDFRILSIMSSHTSWHKTHAWFKVIVSKKWEYLCSDWNEDIRRIFNHKQSIDSIVLLMIDVNT